MTSTTLQSALFVSLLALSAGLKTESIVEMRHDIMMEHTAAANPELKARPKSFSGKVKASFDALEVAIAVQLATQERFAGFARGVLLLVVLAALGLYAVKNQSSKNSKQDTAFSSCSSKAADIPAPSTEEEIEQNIDTYLERQQADEDTAFFHQELNKMLDDSLEAEAEAACEVPSATAESTSPSRAEVEAREAIEQELDRYLDHQHANKDLDADLSVLKTELNKMLDDSLDLNKMLDASLDAEAEAAMVIHSVEEVDVSRVEMEIAQQFSEALGFSQVPAWME